MRRSEEWTLTKVSWRGEYQRLVRLTESALCTLDPGSRCETNRFALSDVLSAELRGGHLLLVVLTHGTCGLLRQQLRFQADPSGRAATLCSAVRAKLKRSISPEDSLAAIELSSESAVLNAMPRELASTHAPHGSLVHSLATSSMAHRETDTITFDVVVAVLKARGFPMPPPLCGGPVVECHWGGSSSCDEASAHSLGNGRGNGRPSLARNRNNSDGGNLGARAAATKEGATKDGNGGINGSSYGDTAIGASPTFESSSDSEEDEMGLLSAPVTFSTAEGEGEAGNPRWNFQACFRYRATEAELRSRRLELRLVHRCWPLGQPIEFGHVRVALYDIATGPHKFDLPVITPSGSHAGRIVFQAKMVQQCGLSISLPEVSCVMRALTRHTSQASQDAANRAGSYSLSVSLTMAEGESQPARAEFDARSLKLNGAQVSLHLPESHKLEPRLALVATASAKAFDQESFHLCVWEGHPAIEPSRLGNTSGPRLLGEVWLPVTKVQLSVQPSTAHGESTTQTPFSEVLWLNGQRLGRLEGCIKITNGPKFVQLPSGFFTEMGILPIGPIAAGKDRSARDNVDLASLGASAKWQNFDGGASPPLGVGATTALADFEQPPNGLKLPKEVELLVSLVQSLRKVILDLHLVGDQASRPATAAGVSASSAALQSATLSDGLKHSQSLTDLAGAELGGGDGRRHHSAAGRLANSEMAARRLTFLMARLQLLLGLSSKESCKAFFYSSVNALQWTQRLLLRLWAYLISEVDSMAYRYQPAVFETLHALMLRGELDCSAMIDGPSSLLERYKRALWETTAYVIAKLSRKAAPTEVRVFCSQALTIAFFRLPALRHELLTTILPPAESRHKHVREWNLPWSLQKSSIAEAAADHFVPHAKAPSAASLSGQAGGYAERMAWRMSLPSLPTRNAPAVAPPLPFGSTDSLASEFVGLEFAGMHAQDDASYLEGQLRAQPFSQLSPATTLTGASATRVDQWSALWSSRQGISSSFSGADKVLGGKYWRERLKKRGHCFFMLLEHWVQHVPMAMGVQPGETVQWQDVPGFATLIKAFLIELKQRQLALWPESMKSCLVAVLKANRQLLQVAVRILLVRTSSLHLRPALAVLAHLDTIFHAVSAEPLPQTFPSDPLVHQLCRLAESEHFKVAASALIFYYTHLDVLGNSPSGETTRLNIFRWLLERFARFSLHWSRVVRTIFFHLVVVKVARYSPPSPQMHPGPRRSREMQMARAGSNSSVSSLSKEVSERDSAGGGFGGDGEGDLLDSLLQRERERSEKEEELPPARLQPVRSQPSVHSQLYKSNSNSSLGERNGESVVTSASGLLTPLMLLHLELVVEYGLLRDSFEARLRAIETLARPEAQNPAENPPEDQREIAEAAVVLGLAQKTPCAGRAPGSNADLSRARGYAAYAWGEYESVVKKLEAADAAAAMRGEGSGLSPTTVGRSASSDALRNGDHAGASAHPTIRRSDSAPTLPILTNPLALSLSMISAHVHDDEEDNAKEHDEW